MALFRFSGSPIGPSPALTGLATVAPDALAPLTLAELGALTMPEPERR